MQQADAREGGFIVLHRKLRSSPLWLAMTGMERLVLVEVLFSANWKPTRILHAGQWHVVNRGELIDAERTLAQKAKVDRHVVRNAIAKMLSDDGEAGGNGPFLAVRHLGAQLEPNSSPNPKMGPRSGPGLRVLIVRKYGEYQDVTPDKGPELGLRRAQNSPRLRPTRARSEPVEPREQGEPPPPPTPWTPDQTAAAAAVDPDRVWGVFQTLRDDRPAADTLRCCPRENERPADWVDWLRAVAAELLVDVEWRIAIAYKRYLADDTLRVAKKIPPWPTPAFMQEGIWRSRVPDARSAA